MSIENELQDIITKNLPKATGDALQARLKKADDDENQLAIARQKFIALDDELREARATIRHQGDVIERHQHVDDRTAAVEKRERDMTVFELTRKLEAEQDKSTFMRDVTMGLVRNVEYRNAFSRSLSENGFVNVPNPSGGYNSSQPTGNNLNETTASSQKAE